MKKFILTSQTELHSIESYFGKYLLHNGIFYITYFNLGISDIPILNDTNELVYIDRAILVFKRIELLLFYIEGGNQRVLKQIQIEDKRSNIDSIHIGGIALNKNEMVVEVEIQSLEFFILLPEGYKVKKDIWVLEHSNQLKLNLKPDISAGVVNEFSTFIDTLDIQNL